MSGDYGVNFIKPFSYISFNEKLPSIQNSIKEYSNTIDDGVNHLKIDLLLLKNHFQMDILRIILDED